MMISAFGVDHGEISKSKKDIWKPLSLGAAGGIAANQFPQNAKTYNFPPRKKSKKPKKAT